ncbi:MAG: glycosyltransferase family 2 protein, partial [Acidobacteria bacterium]
MRASVIIATYNRAHVVCRAISSALAAIRPGDEVIVIDDGSVDQT